MKINYLLAGVLLISSAVASADVLYSTDGTTTPGFFPSNGSSSTSSVYHAFQFTIGAGGGGVLNELVVAGESSTSFAENFEILSDNSGQLGTVLDTIQVAATGDGVSRLYSATSATGLTLVASTTYWIEAASPSGSDSFFWLEANPITSATEYSSARTGTFPDQPSAAFALLDTSPASSTPEPATWLLFLPGLLLFVFHRVHRSRQAIY
jgi:hypothetical protein